MRYLRVFFILFIFSLKIHSKEINHKEYSLAIGFANEYSNYIGSSFGHVFLVFIKKDNLLLSPTLSYVADTEGLSALEVISKGGFNIIPAKLINLQLYEVESHYRDIESREITLMLLDDTLLFNTLTKLKETNGKLRPYNFFTSNCSSYFGELLQSDNIIVTPVDLMKSMKRKSKESIVISPSGLRKTVKIDTLDFTSSYLGLGYGNERGRKANLKFALYSRNLVNEEFSSRFEVGTLELRSDFQKIYINEGSIWKAENYSNEFISRKSSFSFRRLNDQLNRVNSDLAFGKSFFLNSFKATPMLGAQIEYQNQHKIIGLLPIYLDNGWKRGSLELNISFGKDLLSSRRMFNIDATYNLSSYYNLSLKYLDEVDKRYIFNSFFLNFIRRF